MNILSISQVQENASQILPIQTQKSSESEKSSFADFLRDARRDIQKADEKVQSEDSEKVVRDDENAESEKIAKNDEKTEPKNEVKDSKKSDEKAGGEKSEKTPKKNLSGDEKIEKNLEKIAEKTGDENTPPVQNLNLAQISEADENALSEARKVSSENAKIDEIDDKTLSWLVASTKDVGDEEISSEDFAKLIDAAVEFIPGGESETEKLETAQNLAANDPEFFLQNALPFSDTENLSEIAKNEFSFDDKKLSENPKEKKTGAKLAVHDLRTHRLFEDNSAKVTSDKIVQKSAEKKEISLSIQQQNENNVQMTMELASKAQENITSSSAQAAGATGSDFQAMLTNAVQENAPDFVKAGNIVLKDGNQGTINLILRPEGLGNVKISLNLDDKNLSAQIMVHTKEAMEAFKESIPSLKQAFTESGFETGSFDLNFSNGQNQQGFAQSGEQGQNQHIFAQKSYGEFVTPKTLAQEAAEAFGGDYSVNIVA